MKLPIKKKWFDQIKSGEKKCEFRAAHITFICEETKEKITVSVDGIGIMPRCALRPHDLGFKNHREMFKILDDDIVLKFHLGQYRSEVKK